MIRSTTVAALVLAGAIAGCQSSGQSSGESSASSAGGDTAVVGAASDATRAQLIGRVAALEGEWEMKGENDEVSTIVYAVSSGGSAVREIMFPGTGHEMTNMYHMDGDALVMTHYCAGANQPRMRATAADSTAEMIAMKFDSVTDLNPAEPYYMGAMTLVFHGPDRIEQRWTSYKTEGGEAGNVSFMLTRVK